MIFQPNYWHWWWWIISAFLLLLEILVPGTFFLWSGVAAAGMGFLVLVFPKLSFEHQLFIFSVASIISVIFGRFYLLKHPIKSDQPFLNRRGAEFVGRTFTLAEPIIDGVGRVQTGGTSWRVEGPDCPAGTVIKVIGMDGIHLKVELVETLNESEEDEAI